MKHHLSIGLVAGAFGFCAQVAFAAEPADWSKVPAKDITLFYPGASPVEWVTKGTEHGGARALLKKGEPCLGCHEEELADMGVKMASGQKNEPQPIAGKAPSIPVKLQAAHDGEKIYLRFSWQQPAGGATKMDADNQVKLAFMLDDNKVELADRAGCWAACHGDARTMPGAASADKTKYVTGGDLSTGVFYDLLQWHSSKSTTPMDGYIADKRVSEGGKALQAVSGEQKGDQWVVTFVRNFNGGEGDISLQTGKTYNFGFAIHDDYANGRFHHVSLGYTLGIDADADIKVTKQ